MKKRIIVFFLSLIVLFSVGCVQTTVKPTVVSGTFSYEAELLSTKSDPSVDYNSNLFYVNSLDTVIADPAVIYIDEGKDAGWFYAYATSDEVGTRAFLSWRSKDLSHWECMGVAFEPDYTDTWAINAYWAPEVIYDRQAKLYYMFYGAFNIKDNNRQCLSVAYSDKPNGPFVNPTVRDSDGKLLTSGEPVFDFTASNPAVWARGQEMEAQGVRSFVKSQTLDASPFYDKKTGTKYLYFSYHDHGGDGSYVYGVKMKDWFTPDYATLTRLTHPGYETVQNGLNGVGFEHEGYTNEGAFMIEKDGKYYLTFSKYSYDDPKYQVVQAVADSPLGAFRKIKPADGGRLLGTNVGTWNHIVSAGHHSFIEVGDELFITYHTFRNRKDISGGRSIAIDRVVWTTNARGEQVMHVNGPSWSVQPLPQALSGYYNIAPQAQVSATNTNAASDSALLTDGMISYQPQDLATEYVADSGESIITLSWDTYRTVRGFLVYNSIDYQKTFEKIAKVEMITRTLSGEEYTVVLENVAFDWQWHCETDRSFMRPGGAAIAEFDEIPVREIVFTMYSRVAQEMALGEIFVMGSDDECKSVTAFMPYQYRNPTVSSGAYRNEAATFGWVETEEGTHKTTFGFKEISPDAVRQTAPGEQYAFVKDVYDSSLYFETKVSVTQDRALPLEHWSGLFPGGDPTPKFGIVVRFAQDGKESTVFFFVEGKSDYSGTEVGYVLINADGWLKESKVNVDGLAYKNGAQATLAVCRVGNEFSFLCNGKAVLTCSDFDGFDQTQKAVVGLCCYSTPAQFTDCFVTTSLDEIA